ncbi:MAG: AI-2E family transporter [Clostridiaceae bacterium]|nr:AI-2E family transporter [Clostridiaceae bacterium]
MEDKFRYERDRATVITIVKYLLITAIAATVLYMFSKLVVIILPFLIGFVLAKASRHLANLVLKLGNAISGLFKRKKNANSVTNTQDADAIAPTKFSKRKKPSKLLLFFFPSWGKRRRSGKTTLTIYIYAVLVIVLLGSLFLAGIALIFQLNKVIQNIPNWFKDSDIINTAMSFLDRFRVENGGFLTDTAVASIYDYVLGLEQTLQNRIPSVASSLLRGLLSFLGSLPIMLFFVVVVIMSGAYFITDGKKLLRFFARNIKSHVFRHKSFLLLDQLSATLFRVLGGYLSLLIITFFEAVIIFYFAGVDYAVVLALLTAALDFMPVLGVSATMVPLMVYFIIQGNISAFIILLIGMTIITIVRRVIEPPILGNAMNMHPLATLFAMIIGVAIWGAIGFLVGPVVLLIVLEILKVFSFDKKLRDFAGKILSKVSD